MDTRSQLVVCKSCGQDSYIDANDNHAPPILYNNTGNIFYTHIVDCLHVHTVGYVSQIIIID